MKTFLLCVLLPVAIASVIAFVFYKLDERKERDGILEEHPDKGFIEWCENELKVAE